MGDLVLHACDSGATLIETMKAGGVKKIASRVLYLLCNYIDFTATEASSSDLLFSTT